MSFSILASRRMKTSSIAGLTSQAIVPSVAATTIASTVPMTSAGTCGRR